MQNVEDGRGRRGRGARARASISASIGRKGRSSAQEELRAKAPRECTNLRPLFNAFPLQVNHLINDSSGLRAEVWTYRFALA